MPIVAIDVAKDFPPLQQREVTSIQKIVNKFRPEEIFPAFIARYPIFLENNGNDNSNAIGNENIIDNYSKLILSMLKDELTAECNLIRQFLQQPDEFSKNFVHRYHRSLDRENTFSIALFAASPANQLFAELAAPFPDNPLAILLPISKLFMRRKPRNSWGLN